MGLHPMNHFIWLFIYILHNKLLSKYSISRVAPIIPSELLNMKEALWEPRSQLAPVPWAVWPDLGGRCQDRTEPITWRCQKMKGRVLAWNNSRTEARSGSQKAKQLRWTPQSPQYEGPHAWPTSTLVTGHREREAGCETATVAAGSRLARWACSQDNSSAQELLFA